MRKYFLIIVICFFALTNVSAQVPHALNYQTVVRNSIGELEINKLVSFKISILKSSATGIAVYVETHNKVTNEFGLATLEIGGGTILSGNFTNINWGADIYFLKTEFDITGGSGYLFMGTSQLLSVPYSLYAKKAGNAEDDNDKDSTNEIQTISKTDSTVTLSNNGGSFIDSDDQVLGLNGNQLTISSGNTITFTGAVDLDADPTNELQTLSIFNDSITISQGNTIKLPTDFDIDSTNEIQTLSTNGNHLSISNSNTVTIDADTTNELQNLSVNNNMLSITQGNAVSIDADTTNELQSISLNNDSLSLSNGNSIYLSFLEYLVPTGSIMPFAGNAAPAGWLLCNGDTINRAIYNKLFNVIGNSWGYGNDSTTFNLPDLRGQFLRGVDGSANIDPNKTTRTAKYTGGNTGNNVGSYQNDEFETHSHTIRYGPWASGIGTGGVNEGQYNTNLSIIKYDNSGSTGGAETRPVNAYVNYIIKY